MPKDITQDTRSKAGKKAATNMTPAQRKERARLGGLAKGKKGIPKASHAGELDLNGIKIPCAVVNGRRLISQSGVQTAFSKSTGGRRGRVAQSILDFEEQQGHAIPQPLRFVAFMPLLTKDLIQKCEVVRFLHPTTNNLVYGYDCEILTDICELYLQARAGDLLHPNQLHLARIAEILLGGFARTGLVALIDCATGWEKVRDRDELTKILNKYIAAELQPWTRRFHPEFFQEVYRIHGWKWGDFGRNHPSCVGGFINKFVYGRLAPGVLEELQRVNPADIDGKRAHRHHQHLTEDVGHVCLDKHLTMVTAFMRASHDKREFKRLMDRACPEKTNQLTLNI